MISLVDASYLEITIQTGITCAKLKQVTKDMTRHGIHRDFSVLKALSSIQLPLGGGIVLSEFTWYFIIWLPFTGRSNMQNAF